MTPGEKKHSSATICGTLALLTVSMAACSNTLGAEPEASPDDTAGGATDDNTAGAQNGSGNDNSNTGSVPTGQTGGQDNQSGQTGGNDNNNTGGGALPPANQLCGLAAEQTKAVLEEYCSSCHGPNSAGQGGFTTVLDARALVRDGKVVPDDAQGSPLYAYVSSGSMPPLSVQKRPSDADIESIAEWINCGAPDFNDSVNTSLSFVNINTRLRTILDDLRSFPNQVDRERMRYIDLSNLSNAGYSEAQVQEMREAVSFLVNSLSLGAQVVPLEPIDDDELIFRLDLRDYVWDADTWRLLEDEYPYAVIYDQDSRLFPYDEVTAEQIRLETETDIPYIQADWFLSHASRPPLYHEILQLPETLGELQAQLGVDIQENIDTEQVLRAGFKNAGPSQNHRIIERHELGGNRGAFWVSYDFANNVNEANIFANPLDFQEDGGEIIFNLDNGLQAYYIVDAAGIRQDKAPTNVVQDPLSRDGAVENGLSCMTCHQIGGMLPKFDEIRDFVLTTGDNAAETEAVLGLYAERSVLQDAFDQDQNRYRSARSSLGVENVSDTAFHTMDDAHLGVLDIRMVAAVVGVEVDQLEQALDASPQAFPSEIVALRTQGGGVQRDAFEDVVDELVEALGLGEPLRTSSFVNPFSFDN